MKPLRNFLLWLLIAISIAGPPALADGSGNAAQGMVASLRQSLAPNAVTPGLQVLPPQLGWDSVSYPVAIYRDGFGKYRITTDPKSYVANIFASPTVYYVDNVAGSNSNAGTSITTPVAAIWKGLTLCEASAATSCELLVLGHGDVTPYDRTQDINNSAGTNFFPAKPDAIICYGSQRCVSGPIQSAMTWSVNGTYSDVYQATLSNAAQQLNKTTLDSFGQFTQEPLCASLLAVHNATNCWYNDGTNQYYKRADGAAPTSANSRTLRNSVGVSITSSTGVVAPNFYLSGFDVQGGLAGALHNSNTMTTPHNVVVVDSTFRFTGIYNATGGTGTPLISLGNGPGITVLWNVTASNGENDGDNVHSTGSEAHSVLLYNYVCFNVGIVGNPATSGNTSNNCETGHENTRTLTVNSKVSNSAGRLIGFIGTSTYMGYGGDYSADQGDIINGGTLQSTCIYAQDTAWIGLQEAYVHGCLYNLNAGTGTIIATRASIIGPSAPSGGGGTITTF